jgi:protein gp37
MGDTSIEWTNKSWNPIRARRAMLDDSVRVGWHCEPVSGGCKFCYAEEINGRFGTLLEYKPGHLKDVEIFMDERMEREPLKWREPAMVFPCSMTDLFGDFVHVDLILRMFAVMSMTPHLTYQVLTKRPQRMCELSIYFERRWRETEGQRYNLALAIGGDLERAEIARASSWPLPNIWFGTTTEDQESYDQRVPWLSSTPAAVRFISVEPMIGPVRMPDPFFTGGPVDWCIIGCESGRNARPFDLGWARGLIADCRTAGTAPFVKQLPSARRGKPLKAIEDFPDDLRVREWPV